MLSVGLVLAETQLCFVSRIVGYVIQLIVVWGLAFLQLCTFTSLKHQTPETGVQRHRSGSMSTVYQSSGVALSCLKVATLLLWLEPAAVVVTQTLSVVPA